MAQHSSRLEHCVRVGDLELKKLVGERKRVWYGSSGVVTFGKVSLSPWLIRGSTVTTGIFNFEEHLGREESSVSLIAVNHWCNRVREESEFLVSAVVSVEFPISLKRWFNGCERGKWSFVIECHLTLIFPRFLDKWASLKIRQVS